MTVVKIQQGQCAIRIKDRLRTRREFKEMWGRARWPLLCAARGWGDPNVTEGKWRHLAQGSNKLDFMIYAATWYANKELGYYDYANGKVAGGGLAVGGGMCAGNFDGGRELCC
ncbi:hypothetical protein BDZ45DRAFT_810936 [Acephala macrosclerotiorum]|nr:hypothetical protein BDZ45DRAFT_810936 [Acephala macrosclerotiorum]